MNKTLLFIAVLGLIFNSTAQNTPAYISTDSLIAYYPFNGDANDESGNNNDATIDGATLTTDRYGNINSAYSFDGVDDHIDLNSIFDYETKTVSLWFKADTILDVAQSIFGQDNNDLNNGHVLCHVIKDDSISKLGCQIGSPTISYSEILSNKWYMVTLVRESDSSKVYINDSLMITFSSGNINSVNGHSNALLGTTRLFDRYFNGAIDDVIIYNKALSSNEVYNLFIGNVCSDTIEVTIYDTVTVIDSQLVFDTIFTEIFDTSNEMLAHYPFNGNANDESGNGNNASMEGGTISEDRFGNQNSAYSLDGIDDYIDLNRMFDYETRSVNLWFRADTIHETAQTIFGHDNNTLNYGHVICGVQKIDAVNKVYMQIGTATMYSSEIVANEWYMVTLVRGVDSSYIYLNDSLITSFTSGTLNSANGYANALLGTTRLFDRYFKGSIDDINIYGKALTSHEVHNLFKVNSCSDTIIINDTITTEVFDTITIEVYDTIQVIDTIVTEINDTNLITVADTLVITMSNDSSTTGINVITTEVKVYPNPASSQLNVVIDLAGDYTVSMSNINGQIVFTQANVVSNIQIDISEFNTGLYFIKIIDNDGNLNSEERKVVIK